MGIRVIIDILTPKQCMLFAELSERLRRRGHMVFNVTRRYRELKSLLELRGIEARVIGEHGGKALIGKLKASAARILELASYFEEVSPDVAVSFSSPEMARVSYGLGTPHICINDSPHAEAVARLTIPLSSKLLTPKVIPKEAWTVYGIAEGKIRQYNALDPWAWLRGFKPDIQVIRNLGLSTSKPIITVRPEEEYAAYLLGRIKGETGIIPAIERILKGRGDVQIVVIPRYQEQMKALHERFGDKIIICGSPIDGPSLLHYTSIFIGGGGTMTTEAALLGVPAFSCYPAEPYAILKYLVREGLVKLERDPDALAEGVLLMLRNIEDERRNQKERARRLVEAFEDPVEVIVAEVEEARG